MQNWHLLMTKPRDDDRAQQHLLNQGYDIFRPLLKCHKLKKGRQVAVVESLFPRYIFIRLHQEFSDWASIRSTRGVAGLVRFGEYPAVVPDDLVNEILNQVDEDTILDKTRIDPFVFRPGDQVMVGEGSFKGLQAIVKAQTSEERVIILLEMLGKTQALEMPIANLQPIT